MQEHYFRLALQEKGIDPKSVEIDHVKGQCWSKETGWRPLVFPQQIVDLIQSIPKEKSENYFFRGVISEGREWLRDYPNVQSSSYGRQPETKYTPDIDYYETLCRCQFGLAPVGDCPWSYRFFEAIMCKAIPVIGRDDDDIFAQRFVHFRHGDEHVYDPEACKNNLQIFLREHTLTV